MIARIYILLILFSMLGRNHVQAFSNLGRFYFNKFQKYSKGSSVSLSTYSSPDKTLNSISSKPSNRFDKINSSLQNVKNAILNYDKSIVFKTVILLALVIQNSGLALLMRWSRKLVKQDINAKRYITSTAVVTSEFIKLLMSFWLYYQQDCNSNAKEMYTSLEKEFSTHWYDFVMMTIPAGLYVIQNNLQYIAVSNLSAEIYQVLTQTKIITTAFFSTLLLNKKHTSLQWMSVLFLSMGVGVIQLSFPSNSSKALVAINYTKGLICIFISALTSGFAGVYFEKMVKKRTISLWIRNIEICAISFVMALVTSFSKDHMKILSKGFFYGYNPLLWSVILTQAVGGMLVSLVVKHSNSVIKAFATSASIILTCIISALFLNEVKLGYKFVIGVIMVILATLGYGMKRPIVLPVTEQKLSLKPVRSHDSSSSDDDDNDIPTEVNVMSPLRIDDIKISPSKSAVDDDDSEDDEQPKLQSENVIDEKGI
jgi:UDP-sugar transporter A1/2/3